MVYKSEMEIKVTIRELRSVVIRPLPDLVRVIKGLIRRTRVVRDDLDTKYDVGPPKKISCLRTITGMKQFWVTKTVFRGPCREFCKKTLTRRRIRQIVTNFS